MQILVDADACPNAIKTVLFRAAQRTRCKLTLVANHWCQIPPSPFIKRVMVSKGFDVADQHIETLVEPGDIVITADIPLADAIVTKRGVVLTPRGTVFNSNNIKQALAMRDFNQSLRDTGLISGGDAKLAQRDVQQFANKLDQLLRSKK